MKNIVATTLFCASLFLFSQIGLAQRSGLGIGASVNGPTGLSYKTWIDQNVAIAGALGFSVGQGSDFLYTHADVIVQGRDLLGGEESVEGSLSLYYGGGVAVTFYNNPDDEQVDLRIPAGLVYLLKGAPVDVFMELVPTFRIVENTRISLGSAFGVRYYLN